MYKGISFPDIDPVVFSVGFFAVRWYSLAYIAGFLVGWYLARRIAEKDNKISAINIDDFITAVAFGIIIGGRLGYVIFYNFIYYINNPLEIFALWQGGMSFHGGFLGFVATALWFAKSRNIPFFKLTDISACVAPLGLYFGRLANFVNGELFGRVTHNVPWAIIFPNGGPEPRHPSQIYEALLEGLTLLIILNVFYLFKNIKTRNGCLSGLFLIFYGLFRIFAELFREPDFHIGFLTHGTTMGQVLSLPMVVAGIAIFFISYRKNYDSTNS